jgi:hypothetical protein
MSETVSKLTAKAYWDAASVDVDLSQGLRGLYLLTSTSESIQMIEESRLIKLEEKARPYINWESRYKFRLDADLNFILTRRNILPNAQAENLLSKDPGRAIGGLAVGAERVGSRRYAFIDINRTWHSEDVLLHEAAHLLSLKRDSLDGDPQHCGYEDCVMYPEDIDIEQNKYCFECEDQVIDNAEKLRQAKYGKFALAPNALFKPDVTLNV